MSDHPAAGKSYLVRVDEALDPRGVPKAIPCSTCVLRCSTTDTTPFGDEDSDALYTDIVRSSYWTGTYDPESPASALRNGGLNACHQGHRNPCVASLVVQQRELLRWLARSPNAARGSYALSSEGVQRIATRMLNGGERWDADPIHPGFVSLMPYSRLREAAHPALYDLDIGHPDLVPVQADEFETYTSTRGEAFTITLGANSWAEGKRRKLFYIYEHGRRVGYCYLMEDKRQARSAEMSFSLYSSDDCGRGSGMQVATALTHIAFVHYELKRLWIGLPTHTARLAIHSAGVSRIAERLGFRHYDGSRAMPCMELHRSPAWARK